MGCVQRKIALTGQHDQHQPRNYFGSFSRGMEFFAAFAVFWSTSNNVIIVNPFLTVLVCFVSAESSHLTCKHLEVLLL